MTESFWKTPFGIFILIITAFVFGVMIGKGQKYDKATSRVIKGFAQDPAKALAG